MVASFRWVALGTWLGLLAVSWFAPPSDSNQHELTVKLLTFDLVDVNRSLFALFNLMGVWPMVFIVLLAFDTTEQRVWRWPFVLGSFALGAFALLPYLVVRKWGAPKRPADARWLRLLGSRPVAALLAVAAVGLTTLFCFGGLEAFAALLGHNQLAYVMTFDFAACSVAGVLLSVEDAVTRPSPSWGWSLAFAPGVALRLIRAPLALTPTR